MADLAREPEWCVLLRPLVPKPLGPESRWTPLQRQELVNFFSRHH